MGIVVCLTVEAVLEGGGWIAQLAFAHNRELFKVQIAKCLIANFVGDLEPNAAVVFRLAIAECLDSIFHGFAHRMKSRSILMRLADPVPDLEALPKKSTDPDPVPMDSSRTRTHARIRA